jgi:hypothetical protein
VHREDPPLRRRLAIKQHKREVRREGGDLGTAVSAPRHLKVVIVLQGNRVLVQAHEADEGKESLRVGEVESTGSDRGGAAGPKCDIHSLKQTQLLIYLVRT